MNNYIKKNEEILNQWKNQRPSGISGFISDGIVDSEKWFSENGEKILFLLKEAYSKDKSQEWNLSNWLCGKKCMEGCDNCENCWPSGKTYNHVAEAAYMILNPSLGFDDWLGIRSKKILEYKKARKKILEKIAVVNIKKYDGENISSSSSLNTHLKNHGELLRKQIENIAPTVIICGGTYKYLKELLGLEELDNEFNGGTMLGNIKVIAAYHPSKQMSSKEKAEMIFEQYMKLRDGENE